MQIADMIANQGFLQDRKEVMDYEGTIIEKGGHTVVNVCVVL